MWSVKPPIAGADVAAGGAAAAELVAAAIGDGGEVAADHAAAAIFAHRGEGAAIAAIAPFIGPADIAVQALAIDAEGHWLVFAIDVATGEIVSSLKQENAATIRWSADGKTLTVITPLGAGEGGDRLPVGRYDVYPWVHEWDWRSGKAIRSIAASDSPVKE